jgi:hypothetical protein
VRREAAPVVALAVVTVLFAIDCLFNAMINPTYILAAGGLASLDVRSLAQRPAHRGRRAADGQPIAIESPAAGALVATRRARHA